MNYYDILGINKGATKDDIKKAFRKLAHQYHPDKKSGNEQKFKEINEAYQVLSDDKKRAEYDTYGRVFSGGGTGSGFEGFSGFGGFQNADFDFGDVGDIFNDFFGGGRGRARRGNDISVDLQISFEEAVFGTVRTVVLNKTSVCKECGGNGAKKKSETISCAACNGKGKIHDTKRSVFGSFTSVHDCAVCGGRGTVPKEKCGHCGGIGIIKDREEISIQIPSGIENGEIVRMTGRGEAIQNGISGDLYIKVHVTPHETLRREGSNLLMDLNIKLSDALLGTKQKIKTLNEVVTLSIPAGVAFGEILRVRNKGVPISQGRYGDLLIRVNIVMPQKLSSKAKKVIEELGKEGI